MHIRYRKTRDFQVANSPWREKEERASWSESERQRLNWFYLSYLVKRRLFSHSLIVGFDAGRYIFTSQFTNFNIQPQSLFSSTTGFGSLSNYLILLLAPNLLRRVMLLTCGNSPIITPKLIRISQVLCGVLL